MANDNVAMSVAEDAGPRLVRRWREDPRLRKLPVVVYTLSGIFVGDTYRLEEQRLLDTLNRGFVARALRMAGDFVPLADVEAYASNGRKSRLAFIHINKCSILFVGEKASDPQATTPGGREIHDPHPLRIKTPLAVELNAPPYVLEGNVYVESWGELPETIETDARFLPLTDVKVRPVLAGGDPTFAFVAVNRERILYITESARHA